MERVVVSVRRKGSPLCILALSPSLREDFLVCGNPRIIKA